MWKFSRHSIMLMDDRAAPGLETRVRRNRIACPACGHLTITVTPQYLHLICDFVKLYSWLSGQLIFILSSEPLCTGSPYSARSTESVSTTNQLALCSPRASLAHRATSFEGATEVCGGLNMSPSPVAIRRACLSKDSSLLLNAAVVEKTCNCKFGRVFSFLFLPVLEIQLALFYSKVAYEDYLKGWRLPCCGLQRESTQQVFYK